MTSYDSATRVAFLAAIAVASVGCESHPAVHQEPSTRGPEWSGVRLSGVDKVDLLFGIDNSASMSDKQVILSEAIPDLLKRLITPNCVDDKGSVVGVSDATGNCTAGRIEFPAVHDLHIGIVSSSLGGRGGDACASTDDDDRGHLVNRGGASSFLAWLPGVDANKGKEAPAVPALDDPAKLQAAFADMVVGVHESGCGYEAQMESVYRFLVQPDPYEQIVRQGDVNTLEGVDRELLQQRRDFLRPDSLVAVVLLTDENESSVDPLGFGGRSWLYTSAAHVKRGTAQCDAPPGPNAGPNDPSCISCELSAAVGDAKCAQQLDDQTDHPNARFLHMKQRFGVDPRFPVDRYIKGFAQRTVPDRNGEHPKDDKGTPSFNYVGKANCTNPLFATNLPTDPNADLCHLVPGPRTANQIFFGLIGGVPWQLLTEEPTNLSANNKAAFKPTLGNDDWTRILGKDPFAYDFTGIDPHMLESLQPPQNEELEPACTFPISDATTPRTGKAYPTVSELVVAKALGEQAVVASICPRSNDKNNEDYGYRPAVRSIVDRLKNALADQCLLQPLVADANGKVSCVLLATLVEGPQASACDAAKGLAQPDRAVLASFRSEHPDASKFPVCEILQLAGDQLADGSCVDSAAAGWCYVSGAAAGGSCPQAIKFSPAGKPDIDATLNVACTQPAPVQQSTPRP